MYMRSQPRYPGLPSWVFAHHADLGGCLRTLRCAPGSNKWVTWVWKVWPYGTLKPVSSHFRIGGEGTHR